MHTNQTARKRAKEALPRAERLTAGRFDLKRLRAEAAAEIERLIDLLDATDPDVDLEPEEDSDPLIEHGELDDCDREPSLGWPDSRVGQFAVGGFDDREEGAGAREPQFRTAIDDRPKIEVENTYRRFLHGLPEPQRSRVRAAQKAAKGDPWMIVR